jgi:preprotein translocase subunit SecB
MDQTAQPAIKVAHIHLIEATFRLNGETITKGDLNGEYNVEFSLGFNDEKPGVASAFLGVKLKNKKHPEIIDLSVTVAAKFEGDAEQLKEYLPSAGMFLLPFVRSYVATITGWGPMNPVMVPLMNLTPKAMEAMKKQTKTENPSSKL